MNLEELQNLIEEKTKEFKEDEIIDELYLEHKKEFEDIINSIEDEEQKNILLSKITKILSEHQEISEIDEVFIYTILYKILNKKVFEMDLEASLLADIFMQEEVKRENYSKYVDLMCNEEFKNKLNSVTDDINVKRAFLADIIGESEDKEEKLDQLCEAEFEFYGYDDNKKVR